MTRRVAFVLAAVLAAGLLAAAPALASLADEASAGHALALRLQSGQVSCQSLSDSDFEHLGEYVMDRLAGTRATHAALNARMDAVMGAENTDRVHQALGRRYAGCAGAIGAGSGTGGGTMMGSGPPGAGGWGAMMGSGYAWMRDGSWRHMSRHDWENAGAGLMGRGWMGDPGAGWSPAVVIAVVLGVLALGGLVVSILLGHRFGRPRPSGPTPA